MCDVIERSGKRRKCEKLVTMHGKHMKMQNTRINTESGNWNMCNLVEIAGFALCKKYS